MWLSRACDIVLGKYVLNRRRQLKLLSAVALEAGTTNNSCSLTTVPLRRRVTEPPVVSCTRPITCWLADNLEKLFLTIRFRCRRLEGLLGGHTPSIIRRIIQSRQGNRVIHTTECAQERNALQILTQNYRFQFKLKVCIFC